MTPHTLLRERSHLLWSLLLVVSGWIWFSSAGRDDVHITYWSAHTLATQGALLNYSGVPLEQSSSLLQVLLLGALARLTRLRLPDLGALLSLVTGVAAVIGTARFARSLHTGSDTWAAGFAATATPLVYWSFGGLEATLVAFLAVTLVAAVDAAHRIATVASLGAAVLCGGLYVAARPEGWFVVSAFAVGAAALFWVRGIAPARVLGFWLGTTVVFVLLAGWRWHCFGQIFPQPVYAKISGHFADSVNEGWRYALRVAEQCPLLLPLGLAAAIGALRVLREPQLRLGGSLLLAFVAAQCAFAVTSGGDWMEGARFFVPAIPAATILASLALMQLPVRTRVVVGLCGIVAGLGAQPLFAYRESTGIALPQRARFASWAADSGLQTERFSYFERFNRVHVRDALLIPHLERIVDEHLQRQARVVVMSGQGGMVPYYLTYSRLGKVRFVDMAGLTSKEFAGCAILKRELPVRQASGIGMSYDFYLTHRDRLERACGIPRPDIIYDLDRPGFPRARRLAGKGYELAYRQDLDLCPPELECGARVNARMFVMDRVE